MTLREFLNAILITIGAESLTDDEFETVDDSLLPNVWDQDHYDALAAVLDTRDGVSTSQERLVFQFKAKGVDVDALETGKSNIFIGAVLE